MQKKRIIELVYMLSKWFEVLKDDPRGFPTGQDETGRRWNDKKGRWE